MLESDRRGFMRQAAGALVAVGLMPDSSWSLPRLRGEPLEVAVVGLGRQGRAILGELQKMEMVRVSAVCDTVESRLASGLRRAGGARGHRDHRALLEAHPGVKAVIVATPTHAHAAIATDCLSADRHVYCESPLAHTLEDARTIVRAARGSKRVFQVGLQGRSNPIYTLARSFYRSDAVRELIGLEAQSHQKTTWRTPASDPAESKLLNWRLDPAVSLGLEGELGTQQFDVIHFFTGRYPTRVRGSGAIRLYEDGRTMPDTVTCDLGFEDGSVLRYRATLACSYAQEFELFLGSTASIKLAWTAGWMFKEADAATQGWEVYANRQQFHNDEGITLIADATKLASQGKLKEGVGLPNHPLYYALGDFFRSVLEGSPVVCGAEEGLRASAVGIAAHQAVASGVEVMITEDMLKA